MFIKLYIIALPIFLLIDAIWLGLIAKGFYSKHIGALMKSDVSWLSAGIFYLIFIAGLVFFVIQPNLSDKSILAVVLSGLFFGLVTYATYDLTNYATLKDWPLVVVVADLLWGAIISTLVSVLTYLIATKIWM